MRILQLVTKRQYRGAEVFAANLSSELLILGHEIIFAGLYKNNNEILTVDNALNIDLALKKEGFLSLKLIKNLVRLIKTTKPDVIQCNGSDTLKYMVAASYFLPEVPILYRNISMISEWVDNTSKKVLYRNLFKKIAHVSSVGEEAVEDFVTTFDYPRNQTSVIRRGIPIKKIPASNYATNLRVELGLKKSDKIAIHIGNFSPEKNHKFLLKIFGELKNEKSDIKLVCVGNGVLFDTIKAEIKQYGLEDTVFLLGFRKDIPELLAASDCFVLASTVEGVPGVILEAGTQRVPSVATNVGGTSEVLIDGKTGFLIENFDEKDFKLKLSRLLSEDDLRKEFGENAFQLVLNEFNPLKNAIKFEDLYYQLIGGRKNHLKILQLIQAKQYRGAEVFCCQLSNHLKSSGHEVDVVSIYEGPASLPFTGEVKTLNRKKNTKYIDFKGWKILAEIIQEQGPDVIQANAADTLKYAVFSSLVYGWKTPIVYRNASIASFYINNPWAKLFHGFLLKNVKLVVSVSHASKQDLNDLYPFTKEKSIVIPIGLDQNSSLKLIHEPGREKKIIHIGSFTEEKNHRGLLRIFRKVLIEYKDVTLQLVGEGPLRTAIKEEVKQDNLFGEKVQFINPIVNPMNMIGEADILVLPSIVEGLPGVLLEAMFSRTPVVAYDVGGISEIITNKTGRLIPKNNEEEFVRAIIQILEEKKEEILDNAYNMVLENYMNSQIAERFENAYKMVIK